MKHISLLVILLLVLFTSCSKSDDNSFVTNSSSKNKLKEIATTYEENGNTVNFSKVAFSYNDKNQITSLNFSNQSINFILNYEYNTKNQITKIETIDNSNNKSYLFNFSYNDDSMIPAKITRISEPTTEIEILNIDNSLFWKTSDNKLCNISNVSIKDYTFSEYTNNNKITKYKFHENFKNGLEHNNSNFSLISLIFISYMTGNLEFLTIYGLEYLDAPIDEFLLSNGSTLKFEYQMQNSKIVSRIMKNTPNQNHKPVLQTYTYY